MGGFCKISQAFYVFVLVFLLVLSSSDSFAANAASLKRKVVDSKESVKRKPFQISQELNDAIYEANYDEAKRLLRAYLKAKPNRYYYNWLALILNFEGRYVEEEHLLREQLKRLPEQEATYNLANALLCQRRYSEAIKYFRECIAVGFDRANAFLSIASAYLGEGKLREAIVTYDEMHSSLKSNEVRAKMYSEIVRKDLESSGGLHDNGYFDFAIISSGGCKWSPEKMPLKVFIQSEREASVIEHYRPEFRTLLLECWEEWCRVLSDRLSISYVNNPADADIECYWAKPASNRAGLGHEAAACTPVQFSFPQGIVHGKIVLNTSMSGAGLPYPALYMRTITIHEIGHVLGLIDHSPYPDDIMFETAIARRLSERDKKTILHLYDKSVPVAVKLDAAPYFKYMKEQDRLAIQGIGFMSEKKFESAIETFKASINSEPLSTQAAQVFSCQGICYMNLENYADAENCFKQALARKELAGKFRRDCLINYAWMLHKLKREQEALVLQAEAKKIVVPTK